jgi:DNA-binding transcriptional MocR family regulator
MSSEALSWAFKQNIKPSAVKFTLIALCECANYKTGQIFPSIKHIAEITGQDRKTIISNVQKLEKLGLIIDTGEKMGATKQIKVYRVAIETVPKTGQSQKRNSTVNPIKESQKRDTEPSREPSVSKANALPTKRTAKKSDRPDGVSEVVWIDWVALRKAKKASVSQTALNGIAREADRAGWPLEDALAEMVSRNWQGFKADWVKENGGNNGKNGKSGQQRDGFMEALDIASESFAGARRAAN